MLSHANEEPRFCAGCVLTRGTGNILAWNVIAVDARLGLQSEMKKKKNLLVMSEEEVIMEPVRKCYFSRCPEFNPLVIWLCGL